MKILKKAWEKWKAFLRVWGIFNSYLILTIFYFLVVGPIAIIRKLIKFSKSKEQDSYWISKEEFYKDHFRHQF